MAQSPGEYSGLPAVADKRQVRLAALSSVVGTSIEWYDFFHYGTAAELS